MNISIFTLFLHIFSAFLQITLELIFFLSFQCLRLNLLGCFLLDFLRQTAIFDIKERHQNLHVIQIQKRILITNSNSKLYLFFAKGIFSAHLCCCYRRILNYFENLNLINYQIIQTPRGFHSFEGQLINLFLTLNHFYLRLHCHLTNFLK